MSGNSIKTIANSVKQVSNDPELLQFLEFLNTTVCSIDGCYKEYSEKFAEEATKTEQLKEEYLELKNIETLLNHILRKSPSGSELEIVYKSILPYLELLQESDAEKEFDIIAIESEEEINSIVAENNKISVPDIIEKVKRDANLSLQNLLVKKREKIEQEVKSMLPPELLGESQKCSKVLSDCVNSNFLITMEKLMRIGRKCKT